MSDVVADRSCLCCLASCHTHITLMWPGVLCSVQICVSWAVCVCRVTQHFTMPYHTATLMWCRCCWTRASWMWTRLTGRAIQRSCWRHSLMYRQTHSVTLCWDCFSLVMSTYRLHRYTHTDTRTHIVSVCLTVSLSLSVCVCLSVYDQLISHVCIIWDTANGLVVHINSFSKATCYWPDVVSIQQVLKYFVRNCHVCACLFLRWLVIGCHVNCVM